ncbi:MAG TPA: hypothetical protein VGH44_03820 [Candidatus Saccharimonadia bacterium]|jgi:hypothetical protein
MKLLRLLLAGLPAAILLVPSLALAGAPALQITPLQYEDTLSGQIKNGHIDVANPTDASVHIEASVRGFKQQGTAGDLAFYDNADLAAAIKLDLASFDLAPHDAVRVLFSVDPRKLPAGGTYAAIFFRTIPTDNSASGSSYVSQSADIGTLLILTNGTPAAPSGGVSGLNVPFWQFGSGIAGSALVANSALQSGGTAFRPSLTASIFSWGQPAGQATGLVLPGASRRFGIVRPGSYFGLLPVIVTDAVTHTSRTAWVFACTGIASWVVLVLALTILILLILKPFKWPVRGRLPKRPAVATPPAEASVVKTEPDPSVVPEPIPELEPETLPANPAFNPKITKLIFQAESAAPDPGTIIQPEPTKAASTEPARKVSVRVESETAHPEPQTPNAKPVHKIKPQTPPPQAPKPKPAHKVKVQPQDKPARKRSPRP